MVKMVNEDFKVKGDINLNIRVSQHSLYKAIHTVQKISTNKNLLDIANGILI